MAMKMTIKHEISERTERISREMKRALNETQNVVNNTSRPQNDPKAVNLLSAENTRLALIELKQTMNYEPK